MGKKFSKPTVIMIDDYHLQPQSCIEVIRYVIKKLDATILFVLAGRGKIPLPDFPDSDAKVLNLGRFSNTELKKIIKNMLGKNTLETMRIVNLAAGVPIFATEMANEDSYRLASPLSKETYKPTLSLFSLVIERICKIGIDRHLLYFAATMPEPVDLKQLRLSWIANGGNFKKELNKAIDAGLLRKEGKIVRFSHPFLRLVVNHMLEENRTRPK